MWHLVTSNMATIQCALSMDQRKHLTQYIMQTLLIDEQIYIRYVMFGCSISGVDAVFLGLMQNFWG